MFQHAAHICNQDAVLSQYQPAQKKVPVLTHGWGWGAGERLVAASIMGKPEECEPVACHCQAPLCLTGRQVPQVQR